MVSSLDVDGVIFQGFRLLVKACRALPEQGVTFQIEHQFSDKYEPIRRIEWNPLRFHNNKGLGDPAWQFKKFRMSHEHSFEDNWDNRRNRMLPVNLPVAYPLPEPIRSWEELVAFVGQRYRIDGMEGVRKPKWEERLL